ncbi:glycosyltransferase family 2 protein [Devosia sp. SL43]|uniref:glycosyltransferase family 2 protein n=1 Tax=Devosia sp. SL43 TaxID=2806348 RepID=UPI001F341AD5|nr:glycosyltransferase family 2 protein [Devosia sp. SL43]UJW84946.1 glycosyltransferase [Devosia sp. SL43]
MSDTLDLIRAVLAEDCPDDEHARHVLETALEHEVDPLLHCATVYAIDQTLVMERAAHWADYAFYPKVPEGLMGHVEPTRLEALADVRLFRMQLLGRDVLFASPDFLGLLKFKQLRETKAELRQCICLVPAAALRDYLAQAAAESLITGARQNLARRWPYATAQLELTKEARHSFCAQVAILLVLIMLAPHMAESWLLPLVLLLIVGPALIRVAAILTPARQDRPQRRPPDEELPIYSVLIPLHNEAAMVPQLFEAMWALDYPPARLDIKFVVEAASSDTVAAVQRRLGDPRVCLVSVPDALPRTKPKAINFALPLCRGDFVVVYDAEDRPDPDQLWKAATRFRDAPDLVCLQAQLTIDNGHRGWLPASFAGEYSALFTVLLPALAHWRLPIPLGGTSNHFRLSALRDLGGWDAYNVTEDADLGMRLARRRLRVETLASATREHAPTRIRPWLGQRTRWMKGWMQTFIVHNKNPVRLLSEMGFWPMLAFEVLVLGMIVAPLLHSGLVLSTVVQLLQGRKLFEGYGWAGLYAAIMLLGYVSTLAMTFTGLVRARQYGLFVHQLLLPFYWMLMALATLRALRELALRPFHWFKSPHAPVAREGQDQRRQSSSASSKAPSH